MDLGPPPSGLTAWLEFTAKFTAALAAGYALLRWGRAALVGLWSACREIGAGVIALRQLPMVMPALGKVQGLEESVASILKEVRPNGGGSMRDELRRLGESQRRTEVGLTLLANTQRVMYDAADTAVFECDPEEGNTYVNHVYQRWTGLGERELLGFGWINAIAPHDRAAVREEWESAVEDQRDFRMRYQLATADGRTHDVTAHASPVRDIDGVVSKWVGVVYRHDPAIDGEA